MRTCGGWEAITAEEKGGRGRTGQEKPSGCKTWSCERKDRGRKIGQGASQATEQIMSRLGPPHREGSKAAR